MKTIHVRNVPESLYNQIKLLAIQRNRSLSAQEIEMLVQELAEEQCRQVVSEALKSIARRRFSS